MGIIIFALNIEARGQGPKRHGIISIGVCVGSTQKEEVIHKERFDMLPLDGQTMEPQCEKEVWSKHPEHYKTLTKNAKDASIQMLKFRTLLNKYDYEYDDVYIVCNNPGFDFGMINYYLDYYDFPTLNYKINPDKSLSYRNNHDANSYGRAILHQSFAEPGLSNKLLIKTIGADQLNPDDRNDAEFIYKLHYKAVTYQFGGTLWKFNDK